jgi:hypothetical protein
MVQKGRGFPARRWVPAQGSMCSVPGSKLTDELPIPQSRTWNPIFRLKRDYQTEDGAMQGYVPHELVHSAAVFIIPGKNPIATEQSYSVRNRVCFHRCLYHHVKRRRKDNRLPIVIQPGTLDFQPRVPKADAISSANIFNFLSPSVVSKPQTASSPQVFS